MLRGQERVPPRLAFKLPAWALPTIGPAVKLTNVQLWLPRALWLIGLGRLRSGGQRAVSQDLDRDGVAKEHAVGLDQGP